MSPFLSLPTELLGVGFAAFLLGWVFVRLTNSPALVVVPTPRSVVRLSVGLQIVRTRFVKAESGTWILDSSLTRDNPLEIQTPLVAVGSFGVPGGVARFRTSLNHVDNEGRLIVSAPQLTTVQERREEARVHRGGPLRIEGLPASYRDLSTLGGKFVASYPARKGERVRLDMDEVNEPVFGWVLEATREFLRVRFEERISLT